MARAGSARRNSRTRAYAGCTARRPGAYWSITRRSGWTRRAWTRCVLRTATELLQIVARHPQVLLAVAQGHAVLDVFRPGACV